MKLVMKKVSIFLSVVGSIRSSGTYWHPLNRNRNPLTNSSELKKHFQPKTIVIVERFHFHRRNQAPKESFVDFVAQLRRLATHCQFGEHFSEALRDRFVCGLRSVVMQKHVLFEVDSTLKQAIEIVQGIEAAKQHTQQLKAEAVIRKVSPQSTTRSPKGTRTTICNHCGKSNHKSSQCHYT